MPLFLNLIFVYSVYHGSTINGERFAGLYKLLRFLRVPRKFSHKYLNNKYCWPRHCENISVKHFIGLKPQMFSPANLSLFMVYWNHYPWWWWKIDNILIFNNLMYKFSLVQHMLLLQDSQHEIWDVADRWFPVKIISHRQFIHNFLGTNTQKTLSNILLKNLHAKTLKVSYL